MAAIMSIALLRAKFIIGRIRQAIKCTPELAPIQSTLEHAATTQLTKIIILAFIPTTF